MSIDTKHGLKLTSILILCAALAPAAWGRPRPQEGPRPMQEDIQETVEIYMIAKMRRALDLTDEQSHTIIPLVESLNNSRREFGRQRRALIHRLRPLVEEERPDEKEIARLLEQLESIDSEFRRTEQKTRDEIRGNLSPVQQAKFLFFQDRFRQEMQDRLRRLRDDPGRGPGGPMDRRPRPR